MRGDLKNAVAGRVDDRKAGAHVLFAKFLDDFRAGRGLVAERAAADLPFEFRDQPLRKSVRVHRKGLVEPDSRHFPVAGGGVFPRRNGRALP